MRKCWDKCRNWRPEGFQNRPESCQNSGPKKYEKKHEKKRRGARRPKDVLYKQKTILELLNHNQPSNWSSNGRFNCSLFCCCGLQAAHRSKQKYQNIKNDVKFATKSRSIQTCKNGVPRSINMWKMRCKFQTENQEISKAIQNSWQNRMR